MSTPQLTDRQRAAQQGLRDAILECHAADVEAGLVEPGGLLTHCLALAAYHVQDEDGASSRLAAYVVDDSMPWWQIKGLIREHLRMADHISDCHAGDEDVE